MQSLYIHIPFCKKKCNYCSFFVAPDDGLDNLKKQYLQALYNEIDFYSKNLITNEIKTIYIGGGTPLSIGKENLFSIIDFIGEKFNLDYLEEINIELNPDPYEKVLNFVSLFNKKYLNKFFRIRFSIGIQSLDDEILLKSGRSYFYNTLIGFLRDLQKLKKVNNVFNFDFIAFGKKHNKTCVWEYDFKCEFFQRFVKSMFADSFSLYILELFPGSKWNDIQDIEFDEEQRIKEFNYIKKIITQAGYKRYEISNYSLPGRESIHNLVYWNMEDYIGIGINASSGIRPSKFKDLFNKDFNYIRYTNTTSWKKYLSGKFFDKSKVNYLTDKDIKIEKFMLALRTTRGVKNIEDYIDILDIDFENKLENYINNALVKFDNGKLSLTSKGMNFYNQIITDLLKEV